MTDLEPVDPSPSAEEPPSTTKLSPGGLFLRFLRYGFLAWGGPVAQIGLMHRELIERDRWVSNERFRKVLALYQALPGPEANELAVYFGMLRGGKLGGLLAGLGFMLPGVILVTLAAALYEAVGSGTRAVDLLLYGVKPAAFALVAAAALRLGRRSLTRVSHFAIAAAAFLLTLFLPGVHFALVLALGALVGLGETLRSRAAGFAWVPLPVLTAGSLSIPVLGSLAILALEVGFLTFGGAYTSLPILYAGAVEQHQWITDQQFIDGLALTALVPGPLIAIGTFVGYLVAGVPGALLATVLIFGPAFLFTLLGHAFFERMVEDPRIHDALLGVMAAAIGLIAALSASIARAAVTDVPTAVLAAVAFGIITWRPYVAQVVLGGALVGAVIRLATT
jgi:chromate transporter